MANELRLTLSLNYNKNASTLACSLPGQLQINVSGNNVIKNTVLAGTADDTLVTGDIATIGYIWLRNLAIAGIPPAPVISPITHGGTPGSTTDTYVVVADFLDGSTSISAPVTTTTAPATLNGTNYNIITWTDVGAAQYNVHRTVAAGTPSTTGEIATGVTSPYNDQGAAGVGSLPPAVATKYPIQFGSNGVLYDVVLNAGETALLRWNGALIHRQATAIAALLEYAVIED